MHAIKQQRLAARPAFVSESPGSRFSFLEDFIDRHSLIDIPVFVRDAVRLIEESHGSLRVADLHRELDVSRKHLAVSFTRYLGISAKSYAQIQRFLWTLERSVGAAFLHVAGNSTADDIVFGESGDLVLLGSRSLEGLNFRIDPLIKQLVDAGPAPAAVAG